jgi:hypothetical protein
MSTHANILTSILDLLELKRALKDLEIQYQEMQKMTTCDGKVHSVDVVMRDPSGATVGLQKNQDGTYGFIADEKNLSAAQKKKQAAFLNKIKQKYAYNKVVNELKSQGYLIAEEKKLDNNTIKLTARKWS